MKKLLLTTFAWIVLTFGYAQTATNFTAIDCNNVSHDLFSELNSGKVVVITWTMPCGACIPAASTAANTVAGMGNPNVVFYLCDDYGNSTCSTIDSWASTNSITAHAKFSNAAINMTDYGTTGMPKTVVLGGSTCHSVFYNVNGTITSDALTTAINNALIPCAVGITEDNNISMGLSVFPNPAIKSTKINYTLPASANVTIDVMNILGEKISTINFGKQSSGKHEYEINFASFSAGMYYIKLKAGEATRTVKVTVTH
jgi:hypothetical protein